MKNFLAVIAFSLLTVAFFTGYSNYGIPQITPAPPPKEEKLDLGAMSMEQFIALGERLFSGRGTCPLCHNAVGGRAPLLEDAGRMAAERLEDERYKGAATDVVSYLYESMVDPSAFVVPGFGKKGTDDTVSPMPDVRGGSIGLSDPEIKAIVAYLQNVGGLEVTVEIPEDAPEEAADEEEGTREAAATAEAVIVQFGCGTCHKIAGEEGEVGPDLSTVGTRRDREFLRRSILTPGSEVTKGYEPEIMPEDYGEQMYAKELELLLDYMAALK